MIKPGRVVKDIVITKNTNIEKIFQQLQQSGGFESKNLAEGLDILTEMISDKKMFKVSFMRSSCNVNWITRNNQRYDQKQMV